jgi:predicted metal-dependent HD superfamily phosphohydrolase
MSIYISQINPNLISLIYDPKSKDNEADSAKLFGKFSKEISFSNFDDALVAEYILATISHKPENTNDSDLLYFLDFDVAILGKQSDRNHPYLTFPNF